MVETDTSTFEIATSDGVLQCHRPGTRWLSTGWAGGYHDASAAYNVSVPEGWEEVDLDAYALARRERAGFDATGPTLFTGVDLEHARGARCGSVAAVATAGVSNPAALPMTPNETSARDRTDQRSPKYGTVNVVLGTTESLTDGALATLLACVVESKTVTLLAETGFPGTTTDAVIVGCTDGRNPSTESVRPFAGSATPVGAAARACVREAVRGSLASRYAERPLPRSVADAQYGTVTTRRATVFEIQ